MTAAVIAERVLHTALGEMRVTLHAPEQDGRDWKCRVRISGPLTGKDKYAWGVDAFQALHLAQHLIAIDLRHCGEIATGPLRFLDEDHPGFALPPNLADLGWAPRP